MASEHRANILIDARFSLKMRGGDRVKYQLARHILDLQPKRHHLLSYDDADKVLDFSKAAGRITAPWRPSQHPQVDWFEHWALPGLAGRLGINLYHGTYQVLPLVRTVAPIQVMTIADMALFDFPEAYGRKFGPYMRLLITRSLKQATHIIAISESTKREMSRHFPWAEAKTTSILLGAGEEFLAVSRKPREAAKEQARKAGLDFPFILYVGNLEPKKNLPRLIKGFLKAKQAYNLPHRLVVVGEELPKGPKSGVDIADLSNPENIRMLGYVDDAALPDLYRAADLVAYPSLYEGFGFPVLEGLACGTPVLTSNVSSLPEVAGDAGLLVDPMDIDAICTGLHRALTDEGWRREAVERGLQRARLLSWQSNAEQTLALYDRLLKAGPHARRR
jgi:glycosyltransferase involved in cell wall biosynthesis